MMFMTLCCGCHQHTTMCVLPTHTWNIVSFVGLRSKEMKQLRIVSYIQNMNLNLTSIIPGVATVLTFLVHTLLGYGLKTTEVSDIYKHFVSTETLIN